MPFIRSSMTSKLSTIDIVAAGAMNYRLQVLTLRDWPAGEGPDAEMGGRGS